MSWRRFLVLVNNLNPNSAVAVKIRAADDKPDTTDVDDEAAANEFFTSVLSRY
jgi:hypothetical protein